MAKSAGLGAQLKNLANNPQIRETVMRYARDPKVQQQVKDLAGRAFSTVSKGKGNSTAPRKK